MHPHVDGVVVEERRAARADVLHVRAYSFPLGVEFAMPDRLARYPLGKRSIRHFAGLGAGESTWGGAGAQVRRADIKKRVILPIRRRVDDCTDPPTKGIKRMEAVRMRCTTALSTFLHGQGGGWGGGRAGLSGAKVVTVWTRRWTDLRARTQRLQPRSRWAAAPKHADRGASRARAEIYPTACVTWQSMVQGPWGELTSCGTS